MMMDTIQILQHHHFQYSINQVKKVRKLVPFNLNEVELKSATTHLLLNCPEVLPFYNYFVALHGDAAVYPMFSAWFREYNWVPLSHQQNQTASVVEVFRIIEEILKFKEVVEYDGNGRLIIAPDGNEFIPAYSARHIVIEAIKLFYTERWGSWNEIQLDIRILMLNQFVTKCAWNSCYENEIQPIFKLKAALRIKEYLYEARKNLEKPGWLNADVWVKLLKK
ncbi:uncharacterized protein LOC107858568 [Capsicum annuum]|uniref:uncharacterized protein LOC107858568 n=1 Tax=Capsicum annuum TaxID=4072 RepID=UPI001FB18127|nr:uncharacterized protein LOC107858568 [Capsicum annuum]XP_047262315.1 uncharacterized protein LOC107858568 [Capsicum annuum]XP_047262316.1 uncharacterized protein LOC107858568 [Capsicum annuum]